MWVPKSVIEWFQISKSSVDNLREELSQVKAERDILQHQLQTVQINFDWLRMQVNSLQLERTALMEKAYGIKLPAPEIVRTPVLGQDEKMNASINFQDVGEEVAKKLGLPVYID